MSEFEFFHSSHRALKHAYSFDPEVIARSPASRLAAPSVGGGGLVGLDGAALAGWIRAEIGQLAPLHEILLTARYAPHRHLCRCERACCAGSKPNEEWERAVSELVKRSMSVLAGMVVHYRVRRGLIEKLFGVEVTLVELAAQAGVHRDTVSEQHARLVRFIKGDRGGRGRDGTVGELQRAETAIDERLRARGIVRDA